MSENAKKKLNFIIDVVYVVVIIGVIYCAYRIMGLIIPFIIALALVALFQPVINFIHRKLKINQKIISAAVVALLYIGAGSLIFWLVMQIYLLYIQ